MDQHYTMGLYCMGLACKTFLHKLNKQIQTQALRLCCGAFMTSCITVLQVDMGEMLLSTTRQQLAENYWGHLEGHKKQYRSAGSKRSLERCAVRKVAREMGLTRSNSNSSYSTMALE